MNKPTKPNITIPESFAANGIKADFDNNKILNGFDRIQPDVLAGDNLNKFIDDTYKGLNYGIKGVDYLEERWKSQLTNCILEIPQRIKYTLENGTLTIKAGTVVIVPYGFEDLTAQYPKGATFIHDNFKVYDTQFEDGKFFVWVEVQEDITKADATTDTSTRLLELSISENSFIHMFNTASGTDSSSFNGVMYRTDLNRVNRYVSGTQGSLIISLPLLLLKANGSYICGSVENVFNGMGYIGNTIWYDKGLKTLIPNGRNSDGTLNNIEFITDKLLLNSLSGWQSLNTTHYFFIRNTGEPFNVRKIHYYEQTAEPEKDMYVQVWLNTSNNIMYRRSNEEGAQWKIEKGALLGFWHRGDNLNYIKSYSAKHTVNLATKDEIDGQWVKKQVVLIEQNATTSEMFFDLSSYLPNDGYDYNVLVEAVCYTGTTSGNYMTVYISSDVTNGIGICRARTRTAAALEALGSALIPVSKGRFFTLNGSTNSAFKGSRTIVLHGYRRIGTNV